MPLRMIRPWLFIAYGLPQEGEIPDQWARLDLHEGQAPLGPHALHLPIGDGLPWPAPFVERLVTFARRQRQEHRPLVVQCVLGVSRSPAAAVAILCDAEGLTVDQALQEVQRLHPIAQPRLAILASLRAYFALRSPLPPPHPP
ncbi:MAG: hypothetical protein NZ951_08455 [Dehalococcoidia bacterium]|nr:hypothetical protein [Dehalococcoidia bacterium]MDW8120476.1 hypothetical protein [Chloroflexota bacterium]